MTRQDPDHDVLRRLLSRRDFLRRGASVVTVAPLLGTLLSACGGDGAPPGGAAGSADKGAAATKASAAKVDPAVQRVYDEFVAKEIPGVPIDVLQRAQAEGSVTFYHTATASWPVLAKEFGNVFNGVVTIDAAQLNTGPMVERFRSESSAGSHICDVLNLSDLSAIDQWADQGLLAEYRPTSADQFPAAVKRDGFWYPAGSSSTAAAWNTTKVTPEEGQVLKSWEGLQRADIWSKHTIGFVDPAVGGFTSIPLFYLDATYGPEWWRKLASYPKRVYDSINPAADALAAGEVDVIFYGSLGGFTARWSKGAPLNWVFPRPVVDIPYAQAVSANAPHPNAGRLLQEFSLSKHAQSSLNNQDLLESYRPDVPRTASYTKQPWYQLPQGDPVKIDVPAYGRRLAPLIKEWKAAYTT